MFSQVKQDRRWLFTVGAIVFIFVWFVGPAPFAAADPNDKSPANPMTITGRGFRPAKPQLTEMHKLKLDESLSAAKVLPATQKHLQDVNVTTFAELRKRIFLGDKSMTQLPPDQVVKLRRLSLLSLISSDPNLNAELAKSNINSFRDIANLSVEELQKLSKGKLGQEDAEHYKNIVDVIKRFLNLNAQQLASACSDPSQLRNLRLPPDLPPEVQEKLREALKTFCRKLKEQQARMHEGEPNEGGVTEDRGVTCAGPCDSENDIFSPAVYLIYLLDFIEKTYAPDMNSLEKIDERFFQRFEALPVSQEADQADTYVRFANEVLENFITELDGNQWPNDVNTTPERRRNREYIYNTEFSSSDYAGEPNFNANLLNDMFDSYLREMGTTRKAMQLVRGLHRDELKRRVAMQQGLEISDEISDIGVLDPNGLRISDVNLLGCDDVNLAILDSIREKEAGTGYGALYRWHWRRAKQALTQERISAIQDELRSEFDRHYRDLRRSAIDCVYTELVKQIDPNTDDPNFEILLAQKLEQAKACVNAGEVNCPSISQCRYEVKPFSLPLKPLRELFRHYSNTFLPPSGCPECTAEPDTNEAGLCADIQVEARSTEIEMELRAVESLDPNAPLPTRAQQRVDERLTSEEEFEYQIGRLTEEVFERDMNSGGESAFISEVNNLADEAWRDSVAKAEAGFHAKTRTNLLAIALRRIYEKGQEYADIGIKPVSDSNELQFLTRENVQHLADFLLLDLTIDESYRTTPLAAAISRIHSFVQAVRLGKLQYPTDKFDEKIWGYLQSYGIWHAAMMVTAYPENFLMPIIRNSKTEQFNNFMESLEANFSNSISDYVNFVKNKLPYIEVITMCKHKDRLYLFASLDTAPSLKEYYYCFFDPSMKWSGWILLPGAENVNDVQDLHVISFADKIFLFYIHTEDDSDDKVFSVIKFINYSEKIKETIRLERITEGNVLKLEGYYGRFSRKLVISPGLFKILIVYLSKDERRIKYTLINDSCANVGAGGANFMNNEFDMGINISNIGRYADRNYFIVYAKNAKKWYSVYFREGGDNGFSEFVFSRPIDSPSALSGIYTPNFGGLFVDANMYLIFMDKQYIYLSNSGKEGLYPSNEWTRLDNFCEIYGNSPPMRPFHFAGYINLIYENHDQEHHINYIGIDGGLSNYNRYKVIDEDRMAQSLDYKVASYRRSNQEAIFEKYSIQDPVRLYFEEFFLHIPLAISEYFNENNKYEEASEWLKRIYDPYQNSEVARCLYYDFNNLDHGLTSREIGSWLEDPFSPYALADLHLETYLLAVRFAHVQNLLDWADRLFTIDTTESVNRARQLYELAADVLGLMELSEEGCAIDLHSLATQTTTTGMSSDQRRRLGEALGTLSMGASQETGEKVKQVLSSNQSIESKIAAIKTYTKEKSKKDTIGTLVDQLDAKDIQQILDELIEKLLSCMSEETAQELTEAAQDSNKVTIGREFPGLDLRFCLPRNPLVRLLQWRIESNLAKIRTNCNFAGMPRQLQPYATPLPPEKLMKQAASGGIEFEEYIPLLPPPIYRYSFLVERAKQLAQVAQQLESSMLSSIKEGQEAEYRIMQAKQDGRLERANVTLQSLRVTEAKHGKTLAEGQGNRASYQWGYYDELIQEGRIGWEDDAIHAQMAAVGFQSLAAVAYGAGATVDAFKAAFTFGLLGDSPEKAAGMFSALASASQSTSSLAQMYASYQRREQEWECQRGLAQYDIDIANIGIDIADDHIDIAEQEKGIAELRLENSNDTVEFLQDQFLNKALYNWMDKNLSRLYREQLNMAISTAKAAQQALEFERQTSLDFIGYDYWDDEKRGLLAAERLSKDIEKMNEFRLATTTRKKEIEKTISLSSLMPAEFQRFRKTGIFDFETSMNWFDRDFPGHYMRLIHDVSVTVIALVPPNEGIHATLSNAGISRVMVGQPFEQLSVLYRLPESVALSSPYRATGLFELRSDDPMLFPFEGSGVATMWRLEMPKGANRFDYDSLYDVLLTVRYTAMEDRDYRTKVLTDMGQDEEGFVKTGAVRYFSLSNDFVDQWYYLLNPVLGLDANKYWNPTQQIDANNIQQLPYTVVLDLKESDFVPNEERRKIKKVTLAMQTADGQEDQDWSLPLQVNLFFKSEIGSYIEWKGMVNLTIDKFIGTIDGLNGKRPYGRWVFCFGNQCGDIPPDTEIKNADLANNLKKRVKDIWLIIEYEAAVHYNRL